MQTKGKVTVPESDCCVGRMCSSLLSLQLAGGVTLLGRVLRKGYTQGGSWRDFWFPLLCLCHCLCLQLNAITPQDTTGPKSTGSGLPGSNQGCFWPWEMSPPTSGIFWAGGLDMTLKKDLHLSKSAKKGQVGCRGTSQVNQTFNSSENMFITVSYLCSPWHAMSTPLLHAW